MSDNHSELVPSGDEPSGTIPGLIRIAAISGLHTAQWGASMSFKTGRRVISAATHPQQALGLAQDLARTTNVLAELARAMSSGIPLPDAVVEVSRTISPTLSSIDLPGVTAALNAAAAVTAPPNGSSRPDGQSSGPDPTAVDPTQALREQGQQLLHRSRDVWNTDTAHPAYERIITELAPDEGRILLLLMRSGPQPSVDVRTGGPIGMLSSRLIAGGLTMIGARAGCRYVDQVPSYLNNLYRLGLIWFSREQIRDPLEYQVVEAQPEVLAAMHSVRFPKIIRRSIHLTPFGDDFCRTCFAQDDEPTLLPHHSNPGDRHLFPTLADTSPDLRP